MCALFPVPFTMTVDKILSQSVEKMKTIKSHADIEGKE